MEDQISRTNEDSWSKELAEIRSMLQQLIATNKPSPMEFQRFCGENPELWISQAERYFDCYEIGENHKLSFASSYLDGAAMTWYQWLFQNKQLVDWEHFTAKVLIRFRKQNLKSMKGRLPNHWQNYDEQSEYPTKTDAHKVFDERLTSCCPTIFVETQSDTPIEMASEAGTDIESIAVQLFNEHPQSKLSERYVNAFYPDPGSNEQQIHEIETLEGEISADEVVPNAECGKCFEGEERDEGVLLVVSVPQISFSMNLYSPCKGCSTIVVDEFNEILTTSTCRIANTFIDQCLLTQFQFNLGVTTFVVPVQRMTSNFCVWDPGISFEFLGLTCFDKRLLKKYWPSFSCRATSNRGKRSFWAHVGNLIQLSMMSMSTF